MVEIMTREVSGGDLRELVNKLLPDSIAKDIEKSCQGIYPLHDVHIRKIKVLKKPKFDSKCFIYLLRRCAVMRNVFQPSFGADLCDDKNTSLSKPL